MNLLHAIAEAHTMLPADWKSLFKTVLTGGQYSLWWTDFVDLAQTQALNNSNHQPPVNITASQLSGTDMFATVWAQLRLPLQVWDQCTVIAMHTLQKVFDTKKLESGFSAVRQGPQEPYITFTDWLRSAVRWQTDMQEAADAVLKYLAYENVNSDCKKALDSARNGADVELSDYIKARANIDSEQFKAELIATTTAQQLQVTRAAIKCFECRELEHIRKQCPKG